MADSPTASAEWDPATWARLGPYLHAVDLFNAGFWWEAHEMFEVLWHAAGRVNRSARFVQGLILASAACLNRRRGNLAASGRQFDSAILKIAAAPDPIFMGVETASLVAALDRFRSGTAGPPVIVLRGI